MTALWISREFAAKLLKKTPQNSAHKRMRSLRKHIRAETESKKGASDTVENRYPYTTGTDRAE